MKPLPFRVLLAGKAPDDLTKLRYSVLVSPKLDGIRCFINEDGEAVSRTGKPIPNQFVREWCAENLIPGMDGELVLRGVRGNFSQVTSAIMSRDGEPDFQFACFDWVTDPTEPFWLRLQNVEAFYPHAPEADRYIPVGHVSVLDSEELLAMHATFLEGGFEGTMIRSPIGLYKRGRSTTKEGILLKLKAWEDEEATVVGVVEAMHNGNEATVDATGHTKRSTHAAGKTGKDTMGALLCRFDDGAEFGLGTGFTDAERRRIWLDRETFVGQWVKVRHQPDPGGRQPGQAPRIPSFLGFRHEDDR